MSYTSEWARTHRDGTAGSVCAFPAATRTRCGGEHVDRGRSGIELVNLFSASIDPGDDHRCAAQLRKWATEYLTQPHADLGRPGPVCPFTGPSISRGLFWVGFVDGGDIDSEWVTTAVDDILQIFPALPPLEGEESLLKAVLLVFPDISDYEIIERVQGLGKSKFVRMGLMLGQFYPGCRTSGLRNASFRALDAPLPILAIRNMVGSDFPFLTSRAEWVEAYLRKFAPGVPAHVRSGIAEKVVATSERER